MPKPLLVTFAIATHNRGPVLIDCLRRTLANGLPQSQFEIILIDNASTDTTPDLLAHEFPNPAAHPKIQVIRLNSNCGPVAKNIAIRKARGEFIILLDDDAYPHPGAVPQMIRHFRDNLNLAAAVFDVTLPDGSKDAAAYPDVFIGAGTGLRRSALEKVAALGSQKSAALRTAPLGVPPSGGPPVSSSPSLALLPAHFFMQAEEYDLSFRLLDAGFSVQRFWDLPLTHLKTPNARIGQRTTALDVRNNLFLLARYIPDPLAHQLAADWMARYWMMAETRDADPAAIPHPTFGSHRQAYVRGAEEGLARWEARRNHNRRLLAPATIEKIFKFQKIRDRLAAFQHRTSARKVLLADLGKNTLAYWLAAQHLNLQITAIIDQRLGGPDLHGTPRQYRNIPILPVGGENKSWADHAANVDAVILTNMSPVQAPAGAAAIRRVASVPVIDLFSPSEKLLHRAPA